MRQSSVRRFMGAFLFLLVFSGLAAAGPEAASNAWRGSPAKYVFLFVGDGMGREQIRAAELYAMGREAPRSGRLSFTQFEGQGICATHSANAPVTDSAPAATALASGYKTENGVINMDPERKRRFFSVAHSAKARGMKVGVVSSVSINQATPAAFYAFAPSRKDFYDIGLQLVESEVDYFGGGGFHRDRGRGKDKKSLYDAAAGRGVAVLRDREAIMSHRPGGGRVFAVNPVLDSTASMPYAIDGVGKGLSLADFTRKGIEILDNPRGFFMHVEGGKIDWACHANDAAAAIGEVLAFDEAVREALRFARRRPDETLIVVVGDHETGGMRVDVSESGAREFFRRLSGQKESYLAFERKIAVCREAGGSFKEFLPALDESFGLLSLTEDEAEALRRSAGKKDAGAIARLSMNLSAGELQELEKAFRLSMAPRKRRAKDKKFFRAYGGYEPLAVRAIRILNGRAGIGWRTFFHTGVPVPVHAHGVGAGLFQGHYDNTDIAWKIFSIMGLKAEDPVPVE